MKTKLLQLWHAQSPRDRKLIVLLSAVLGVVFYICFVYTTSNAYHSLQIRLTTLQTQAANLERDALEIMRLRGIPPSLPSQENLHARIQAQVAAAGLSSAVVKIEAPDEHKVVVAFSALPFTSLLNWMDTMKTLHIRVESCKVQALATPGMVSATATLRRTEFNEAQ